MEALENIGRDYYFFKGGGEMGALCRQKDWSTTKLGSPDRWPAALRNTISIILSSKFPMFAWWGKDLISFYNDAYRPSLGMSGKHPDILGMPAKDAWPEIWDVISPIIDRVLKTGEATWSEDQLIPIYRNGQLEDVYWTFSYSPLTNDDGEVNGVLVTCTETTTKVLTLKNLGESENKLRNTILQAPIAMCIFKGPQHIVELANNRMFELWGKPAEAFLNKPLFEGLHEARHQGFEELLDKVYNEGKTVDAQGLPVTLFRNNKLELVYVDILYQPYRETDSAISGVLAIAIDVTAQSLARKKIEEAEEKARLAIRSAELGVYEIDYGTDTMTTDDRFKEIWGVQHDAARADYAAAIHPEDHLLRKQAHEASLLTGHLFYRVRVVWNDKSVRWVQITGKVTYEKEKPVKLIGVIQDITSGIAIQQKIEESERNMRSMILQSPVAMCIFTGPAYTVEIANEKMYELWGKKEKEMLHKPIFTGLPEAKEQGLEEVLLNVLTKGEKFIANERPVSLPRNGHLETVYVNFVYEPLKAAEGRVTGILAIAIDVTAQVSARQKIEEIVEARTNELRLLNQTLKNSEERYHLMVEEVEDYAILYLNREGIVENWNKGAEKIKGYTAEEIIGKSFSNFYTAYDKENDLPGQLLKRAVDTGKAAQEGWRVRKDGTLFWASVVITAVHDEHNNVIGFSKVTHDLTEKKNADERLKASADLLAENNIELQKINTELQSFAYISSHDLQEPLRKIQIFASQILESDYSSLSENGKNRFHRIENAAMRMKNLINDLLEYSRMTTAERKFELSDLKNLVEEVKAELTEEIRAQGALVDIGPMCSAMVIPFQFKQMMHNLIGNALKFKQPDKDPRITIDSTTARGAAFNNRRLEKDKLYCHITVSDNGIGFQPEYSDRIFEVFQRLHGKHEFAGTGIGLSIVKKIVENHQGDIIAHGDPYAGATFEIWLAMVE